VAETSGGGMPPASRALSGQAAIVGVGETDYHLDYQAARAKAPGYEAATSEELAERAFERALADSGLRREDIDGLSVSFIYGGAEPTAMAERLRLKPRHIVQHTPIMAGPLPVVCAEIAAGKCDTVAMIYAASSRSSGRQYGGSTYQGMTGAPASYYYHLPWGWSSQAAHWAFVWSHYMATFGAVEQDLGAVAVQVRKNAMANPNAVMQAPMTIEGYMASRYVVRPLHLLDLCLVNDGAVCLIVRRADMARDLPNPPALIAGWGESVAKGGKMGTLVRERLRPQMQDAGAQALGMAGVALSDIQHFEGYDAATIHLVSQIEGYGFAEPGTALERCKAGDFAVGGALPINVNGGMLSGAYMHGWNQVAEVTRQLRGQAGARQIPGLEVSMFSMTQTDQAHPLIFKRGA
jgi:acetyl-CoA acetyltransferase